MNKKRLIILLVLSLVLLSITTVSATDTTNNNTISDSTTHKTQDTLQSKTDTTDITTENPVIEESIKEKDIQKQSDNDDKPKANSAKTPLKSAKDEDVLTYDPIDGDEVTVTNYNDLYEAINEHKTVITLSGNNNYIVNNTHIIKIESDVTINGNGKTITGAYNLKNVFEISEGINVIINNLNFEDNTVSFSDTSSVIYNKGNLEIYNSNFKNNSGNYDDYWEEYSTNGGAIYNEGYLKLSDCNFTDNVAMDGGAIYHSSSKKLEIENCNFTHNIAHDFRGGGAIASWSSDFLEIYINNSYFINNKALNAYGGSAIIQNNKENGDFLAYSYLMINNSYFINNIAESHGTIYQAKNSTLNISNSEFNNNYADEFGGAIYQNDYSNLNMNNCTLFNNTAYCGGALYSDSHNNLFINNSTFSNNYVQEGWARGGAIFTSANGLINNTKFINNTGVDGGAIFNYYKEMLNYDEYVEFLANNHLLIANSSFINNSAINGSAINNYANLTLVDSNITHNYASNTGGALFTVQEYPDEWEGHNIYGITNIKNNVFKDNYVTNEGGWVVRVTDRTTIQDNLFVNNTDNTRDMLFFKDILGKSVNGNTYVNNYLEDYWNITDTIVDVFSNKVTPIHVIDLRDVYNNTIVNGTIYCYNEDGDEVGSFNVTNGDVLLKLSESKLSLGEHTLKLRYESFDRHYQDLELGEGGLLKINLKSGPKAEIYAQVINDIEGNVAIEIKVFDGNDDEILNTRLNITLDDDDTTFTTINTNRIYVNPNLTAGKHNITIKYPGNEEYSETTLFKNFTVVSDPNKLIENLTLNITNLEKNVTDLQNQIDNITQKNLTQLQNNITNLQNQINNITKNNITKLEQNITNLTNQIIALNKTINILNQTIQDQNITKLNQTVQELIQEVTGMNGDIADLKNQIKDIGKLQQQINELKNQINKLETLPTKIINIQNQINNILNNNLTNMEEKIKELETLNQNITDLQNQINELETLNQNITDLQNQINNITDKDLTKLTDKIKNLNGRIIILNNTITTLNMTIQNQNITGNITDLQNQINELKNNTHHCDIRDLIITQNGFLETIIQILQNNQNTNNNPTSNVSPSKKTTKKKTKITAKKKTFKSKTKTKKYKATLKTGKKRIAKVYLYITIKGKKYKKTFKAKTNKKGTATFKIKKLTKKGKYTATIKYKGNKKYKKTTKKVKITVKK